MDTLEERIVATHEAGHAVATRILLPKCKIKKITCFSGWRKRGYIRIDFGKVKIGDERDILLEVECFLAGRVAEKIVFGVITEGSKKDIQKACKLLNNNFYKENWNEVVCDLVTKKLNEEMKEVEIILIEHKKELQKLSKLLRKKKKLNQKQIEEFFQKVGI